MNVHRPHRSVRAATVGILVSAASVLLTSCGLGTAGGFTPSGELSGDLEHIDLEGVNIAIGSKNFTEQVILGKIGTILLESAGANVQDLTNVPGSTSARQALETGDMDMMFEYTGTAWITYLGETDPIPDMRQQYEAVAHADSANGLTWLPPAPMNNTYAMATTRELSEQHDLHTLADIGNLPPDVQSHCTDAEFYARNDGLIPMLEEYGVESPTGDQVRTMDSGAVYAGVSGGECTFGSVFATDGRIRALDLVVLEDPADFFPLYNMAPVIRTDTFEENPSEFEELFAPLTESLTNEKMQELNARVDVGGEDYTQVAWDFVVDEGWVEP